MTTTRNGEGTYEIPFVVWVSDKYRHENAAFTNSWNTDIPYISDKTAYSIIDLMRMSHPSIDLTKSIFRLKNNKQ